MHRPALSSLATTSRIAEAWRRRWPEIITREEMAQDILWASLWRTRWWRLWQPVMSTMPSFPLGRIVLSRSIIVRLWRKSLGCRYRANWAGRSSKSWWHITGEINLTSRSVGFPPRRGESRPKATSTASSLTTRPFLLIAALVKIRAALIFPIPFPQMILPLLFSLLLTAFFVYL